MNNKIFKLIMVIFLIAILTINNFVLIALNLVSYGASNITTNHDNVEFDVYFKTAEGESIDNIQTAYNNQDIYAYIYVDVLNEGYFDGKVTLEGNKFTFEEMEDVNIKEMTSNTITLNQVNVGSKLELKVKMNLNIENNKFNLDSLSSATTFSIEGNYKDSTEKDIQITASRDITVTIVENNTTAEVVNNMEVITNKLMQVQGEEKRVVQVKVEAGLIENNYPIQNMEVVINVPEIDGKNPESVASVVNMNNMTKQQNNYSTTTDEYVFTLQNEANQDKDVNWKKSGQEEIIVTLVYDKDAVVQDKDITSTAKITLYNSTEIEKAGIATIVEEKDSIIEVNVDSAQKEIYKGNIYSDIEETIQTVTTVEVNYSEVIDDIIIEENAGKYVTTDSEETVNMVFTETKINKENMIKVLGESGTIQVLNNITGETLVTITKNLEVDAEGNIVVVYPADITSIEFKTSAPIDEGKLIITNTKTIKNSTESVEKAAESLKTTVSAKYNEANTSNIPVVAEASTKLVETITKASFETNRTELSTVVKNNIEMKIELNTTDEKYDLYKNPQFIITMPNDIEKIDLKNVELMYAEGLAIKNYSVNGRDIIIDLEGEQIAYPTLNTLVLVDVDLTVNAKATTAENSIVMKYTNENANRYEVTTYGEETAKIKTVAATDVTLVSTIPSLGKEVLAGQEESVIDIEVGQEVKNLELGFEVINNNSESIKDVKIMGNFPTNNTNNNMNVSVTANMAVTTTNDITIYYTENENATDDVTNTSNGWKTTIDNGTLVKKYLVVVNNPMASGEIIEGRYSIAIPANLVYNQKTDVNYQVKYTNTVSSIENTLQSTNIELNTGVGPEVKAQISATVAGQPIINNEVKNGEVIKYSVRVENTGTVDVTDVKITGNIDEGTTLLSVMPEFEYSGDEYYLELSDTTYVKTIDSLKVGEVEIIEYEVKVKADTAENTEIIGTGSMQYNGAIVELSQVKNIVKKGVISTTIKRITEMDDDIYEHGTVEYLAIVENISSEVQNDISLNMNYSENLEIFKIINTSNSKSVELDSNAPVVIDSIEPGAKATYIFIMSIKNIENELIGQTNVSVSAVKDNVEYKSNVWTDEIYVHDVDIVMSTETPKYVKTNDTIVYDLEISNNQNTEVVQVKVTDMIPNQLTITRILVDGVEYQEEIYGNEIRMDLVLKPNQILKIQIEAIVDYSSIRESAETISNYAILEINGIEEGRTDEIIHIIEANIDTEDPGTDPEDPEDPNVDPEDPTIADGNQLISGVAWEDLNTNGIKDSGEPILKDVKVTLLDSEKNTLVRKTDGSILEVTTDEKGVYLLENIDEGSYIVIFEFDSKYGVTKYKVEGAAETVNSNATMTELVVDNETKTVPSTDIIVITDGNISDVNIGLIELKDFDLELNKYVSKVILQNNEGTTQFQYNKETLAKVEIDSRYVSGSTVIIEYVIEIVNSGEVEGQVRKIADYIPSDLEFSSEMNNTWYQTEGVLYNTTLVNDVIKPGETREIKLVLTKTMTQNNLGLVNNTAEIDEDYNELGISDINSTPGNKVKDENDMGLADLIIGIETGGDIYILVGTITGIIGLAIVAIILVGRNKKMKNKI